MRYASTDWDTMPAREQLSAHEVLCPGCYSHDLSNRDILLQKALFLSQFLRLFMIIDGVFPGAVGADGMAVLHRSAAHHNGLLWRQVLQHRAVEHGQGTQSPAPFYTS